MLHVIENLIGGYDDKGASPASLRDYVNKAFHVDAVQREGLLERSRSFKSTARPCIRVGCRNGPVAWLSSYGS